MVSSDLSVSSPLLPVSSCLSVCLSAHIGVMHLAGYDTLTSVSAEVCKAVHILADLSDCSNSKADTGLFT